MLHIEPRFPESLLQAAVPEKLHYFEHKIVGHAHLEHAYNLSLDCIEFGAKGEVVPIVGPKGVGTSQLARKLWQTYRDKANTVEEDGQVSAASSVIALQAPSQAGCIDANYWKRLLSNMLHRGGDMLIDHKLYVPASEFALTHPIPYADPLKKGVDTLLQASANMLQRRQTPIVLINQADRLFPESDPGGCTRSQQTLMDLAALTDTRIVLIGGYRLVQASCENGHWLHRQSTVHVRRYDCTLAEEFEQFVELLMELLAHLPTERRLKELSEGGAMQMYMRSVGCGGTAKRTLWLALQHALRTGERMTEAFILQFAPANVVALEIARDARRGEELLMDVDFAELEQVLNPMANLPKPDGKNAGGSPKGHKKTAAGGRGGFGRHRIGERRSSRDHVGGGNVKKLS
jgi:hypothetical protein